MKRERLITERDLFEVCIKHLKQQIEYRCMHNNDHYHHEKCKETSRIKKSDEL